MLTLAKLAQFHSRGVEYPQAAALELRVKAAQGAHDVYLLSRPLQTHNII